MKPCLLVSVLVAGAVHAADGAGPSLRSGQPTLDARFAQAVASLKDSAHLTTRELAYTTDLGLALLAPEQARQALQGKLASFRQGRPAPAAGTADGLQVLQQPGDWPANSDRTTWALAAAATLQALPEADAIAFAATTLKALSNTVENDRLAAYDAASGLYTGGMHDPAASTLLANVTQYQALMLAARLARRVNDHDGAARYQTWADQLKRAINARLWLQDAGMYSSATAGQFDGAPQYIFDWMGQSLAIVAGIADAEQARSILSHYPHLRQGGATARWPLAAANGTASIASDAVANAYGLRAATATRNVAVADAALASLAAPVPRDAPAAAAYVDTLLQLFGISATTEGLSMRPFMTARARRELFAGSDLLVLDDLILHGKRLQIKLLLPPPIAIDGYYTVASATLNGQALSGAPTWKALPEQSVIELKLGDLLPGHHDMASIDSVATAPAAPILTLLGGALHIAASDATAAQRYNLYRDGTLLAKSLPAGRWQPPAGSPRGCYAAESAALEGGLRSLHSAVQCTTAANAFDASGSLTVSRAGRQALQLHHAGGAAPGNSARYLRLLDASERVVAAGVIQFTPSDSGNTWSTPLFAQLAAGRYRWDLAPFYDMHDLQGDGARQAVEIRGARLRPAPAAPTPIRHGTVSIVDHIKSPQLGNERSLRIYLPPGYADHPGRRYPVLYMHDGQNLFDARTASYGTEWQIDEVADRLQAQGLMQEVIVVGIDNTPDRIAEYTPCCDPKHGGGKLNQYGEFIVRTVKPWVDRHYRTLQQRQHTAIMGSSLGGLASIYLAQHYPQVFGMAGGMSSSFWWNDGMLVKHPPKRLPLRLYVDAGSAMDGMDATQAFRQALLNQGYREPHDLYFVSDAGGIHNEQSWAARVHLPLTWMFPPPAKR